jgi:hypothetical protein
MANVVRLDATSWMVIDLEHCREAARPLPDDTEYPGLCDWDLGTVKERSGREAGKPQRHYDELSDMYQIGGLLQKIMGSCSNPFSANAQDFVSQLRSKALDAAAALRHAWLSA